MQDNYNTTSKLLHHLVLGNNFLPQFMFELEKKFFLNKKSIEVSNYNHFFLSGLARSGSTIISNTLYSSKKFSSLKYADMPFVLSPNIWHKFKNQYQKNIYFNRPHTDKLKIDLYSIDSFEEIFWRVFSGKHYIKDNLLQIQTNQEILTEFSNFIKLILINDGRKNYLSKNNNNILRINDILDYFKLSFFILTFRDPLQQAMSLLNQHRNFINLQNNNKFIKSYMKYLVHFEFGLNQKKNNVNTTVSNYKDNLDINFWLEYWFQIYSFCLNINNRQNILFVCYEDFCSNPNNFLKNFSDYFKPLNYINTENVHKPITKKNELQVDKLLLSRCYDIYKTMKKDSIS